MAIAAVVAKAISSSFSSSSRRRGSPVAPTDRRPMVVSPKRRPTSTTVFSPVHHLPVELGVGARQLVVVDLVLDHLPLAERPAKGRMALERVDGAHEAGRLGGMVGSERPDDHELVALGRVLVDVDRRKAERPTDAAADELHDLAEDETRRERLAGFEEGQKAPAAQVGVGGLEAHVPSIPPAARRGGGGEPPRHVRRGAAWPPFVAGRRTGNGASRRPEP